MQDKLLTLRYHWCVSAAFYFEKRDLWIGVYWHYTPAVLDWMHSEGAQYHAALNIYICLLPCFPIKLSFTRAFNVVR